MLAFVVRLAPKPQSQKSTVTTESHAAAKPGAGATANTFDAVGPGASPARRGAMRPLAPPQNQPDFEHQRGLRGHAQKRVRRSSQPEYNIRASRLNGVRLRGVENTPPKIASSMLPFRVAKSPAQRSCGRRLTCPCVSCTSRHRNATRCGVGMGDLRVSD
jgi:hypothetical protein